MAYNITGVKTINELDSNSNISQSTIFIIGNGTDLKKCQYSDLSSRLDNDLNVNEKITNDINDLKDEISLSVSDLCTSLSNEIDVNFAKKDSLNSYYNKDEIENKITEINSKTIPVASDTTIGGFIVANDSTESEIISDNDSNYAKYPVKLFESSNKHQSNVAYVEIDNTIVGETNENVATIQSNLNNLTDRVNTITGSTVTSETTNKLSSDIETISTDLNDAIDDINNLVNELYGEEFNRNSFLSVHYISSEVISSLSGTYQLCSDNIVNGIVTLKYQDSQWKLIIDNDNEASISVISSNVDLSTFGLSVINVNDNTEITSFLSNDIIDIELHKDKQTGNYITCYIDYTFTNGEKSGGDIGLLSNIIDNIEFTYEDQNLKLNIGNKELSVDCTDFIKDGMISSVSVDNENKKLVISWNTDSDIEQHITEIKLSDLIADEVVTHNDLDEKLSDYVLSDNVSTLLSDKIDISCITNDWHDISSASETDKKIPTAYAIREYINQVLKSIV